MAINHDMIRKAVEAHKAKTGHDAQYFDGGATPDSFGKYVEDKVKNIKNPGDRLVERANVVEAWRKKHKGKIPGDK